MTDRDLMQLIRTHYAGDIGQVCAASSIPPALIAALIANESGGDPNAKRFEPGVLSSLWQVLMGRKTTYDRIPRKSLLLFVVSAFVETPGATAPVIVNVPDSIPADSLQRLDRLATSFGITQIMGWHVLESGSHAGKPASLVDPVCALNETVRLLTAFATQFQLDVTKDFADLLDCWNSGDPVAGPRHTYDPDYVPKGLARLAIYQALP